MNRQQTMESSAPPGVRVMREDDSLRIRRRWVIPKHILAVPFAIVLLYFAVVRVLPPLPADQSVHRYITSAILAVVGLPLAYYALTGLVNSRTIVLTRKSLRITDGPLLTPRSKRFDGPAVRRVRFDSETRLSGARRTVFFRIDGQLSNGATLNIDRIEGNERQARHIYETIRAFLRGH